MAIPTKIAARLSLGLKRFQPIISSAKARDANESDTSMIVTDMMAELFGYDKYSEITKELAIRGTYCDLATKIEGKYQMLIEVKAVGIDLKESHVKQAVDYASNKGIEWVALTNANDWKVFKVIFSKPIDFEMVLDIDLLTLNFKNETHLESLFLLTRERDVKVPLEDLRNVLIQDVLKREVIEGEKADIARKKVQKASGKLLRSKKTISIQESSELPQTTPHEDIK
jgi:predicted type IV restriction endonuclease